MSRKGRQRRQTATLSLALLICIPLSGFVIAAPLWLLSTSARGLYTVLIGAVIAGLIAHGAYKRRAS